MKVRTSTLRRIIREELGKKKLTEQEAASAGRGPMGSMVQGIADQIDTNLHTSLVDFFQTKVGPFAAKNLKVQDVLPGALRKTGLADSVGDVLEDIVLSAVDDSAEQLSQAVMANVVDSMPAPVSEAIKRHRRRRLTEEAAGAPCPHATAAALQSSGMGEADIIGWVADLLNDLRAGDISGLTADDLVGMAGSGEGVTDIVEL